MRILHTRNLEGAARELTRLFPRVLVRNKNNLWAPIRLRRSKLADLEPYIVMNAPAFDAELLAWNERGGTLIYDRSYKASENIAAHEAQLVSECPLSVADLDAYLDGTRELAVVYRPPKWDEHKRCARDLHPGAEICKAFHDYAMGSPSRPDIAAVVQLPERFTAVTDEELAGALKLSLPQLTRVRNATLRKRDFRMVHLVVPRIAPPDRTLAEIYYHVVNTYPTVDGAHVIVGSQMSRATRFWKVALRDLARMGAIDLKPVLYTYFPDVLPPHWFKIDAQHRRAQERLEEIIEKIEASPEFSLPPETTPPRSSSPGARSRSKSFA